MLSPLFALAWVFGLCSALLFLLWHCRNALLARVLPQGENLIDIELAGDVFLPFDILPQDTAVPEHVIASLPVFLFPGSSDGASSDALQPSAAAPRTKAAASAAPAASAVGGSGPADACACPAADKATAVQQQQQQEEAMTWVQKLCAQQQSEERAQQQEQQQQQRQALADAAKHYTGISLKPQSDPIRAGQPARNGSSDTGSSSSSSSSSEEGCSASSSSSQRGHRAGVGSSSSSRSCAARLCRRLPQPHQQQCDAVLQQDQACRPTHHQQQQLMDGDAGCSSSNSSTSGGSGGGGGSAMMLSSSDSLSCVICCDDYQAADLVKQLPCKHCMHAKCIDAWLRTPRSCGSCPLCKVPVWQPALAVRSSAHGCFILTAAAASLERRGVERQVQGEAGVATAAPPAASVATVQTE